MSVWTRIAEALRSLASGEGLEAVFDRLRQKPEASVGFTIAVIALGAKMAKADGHVSRAEVSAFREVFLIAPEDEAGAARVFDLARKDVAGYESYARAIARAFRRRPKILQDLLEGLFHISMADGGFHPDEDEFLQKVAEIFGIAPAIFARLRARHVPNAAQDPYAVLGINPGQSHDEVRRRWRALVRDNHPDRMVARGLPQEAVLLANARLTAINEAWATINRQWGQRP